MEQRRRNVWDNRQVKDINNCRLYLQVETISDIANVHGDKILPTMRQGYRGGSTPVALWPVQARPEGGRNSAWAAWKKFLDTLCTSGNTLRRPLGEWENTKDRLWSEYYSPEENKVYIKNPSGWTQYKITNRRRRTWELVQESQSQNIHMDGLIPCKYIPQARAIRPPKYRAPVEQTREASSNPSTWQEFVQSLPEWEQDLLRESKEVEDTATSLIEEINRRTGQLYVVTDGGAAGVYGSYGWVVATKDKVLWRGRGKAKGYPMDSHRAEGTARVAGLLFLQ
jgi:hypothetical protein